MTKQRPGKDGAPRAGSPDSAEATWSVPVAVSDVPDTGRHFDLIADTVARAAVASLVGAVAVPRLEARLDLVPIAKKGVRVSGTVSATVEQRCVVTLEPLTSEVSEPVELSFMPASNSFAGDPAAMQVTDDDPPEVLSNGVVDLGAVAVEFLMLGIEPYPRKAGTEFQPPSEADDPAAHPFAALASLKSDPGKKH